MSAPAGSPALVAQRAAPSAQGSPLRAPGRWRVLFAQHAVRALR
ncbi:MAG: hypothetical protein U1F07_17040 [Rubrivivax sp.]